MWQSFDIDRSARTFSDARYIHLVKVEGQYIMAGKLSKLMKSLAAANGRSDGYNRISRARI